MGREFELKYDASLDAMMTLIARYPQMTEIEMKTTYYDDHEGRLSKLHWTLRKRMENQKSVCSLKTPAGGMARGEWEVEGDDIMEAIPRLCEIGAPLQLLALTAEGVKSVCGAEFVRRACLVEVEGAVVELAVDTGLLLGGGQTDLIMEVEVELKEGSEAAAVAFGEQLARELGMKPEYRSKVGRARKLAGI